MLILALGLVGTGRAEGGVTCDVNWNTDSGGFWDDGANWDNGVPDAGDNVCIDRPSAEIVVAIDSDASALSLQSGEEIVLNTVGSPTLTLGADSEVEGDFTINPGATLNSSGALTVGGTLSWLGGNIEGPGTTTANGGLVIEGTGNLLAGHTLQNGGDGSWSGNGLHQADSDKTSALSAARRSSRGPRAGLLLVRRLQRAEGWIRRFGTQCQVPEALNPPRPNETRLASIGRLQCRLS